MHLSRVPDGTDVKSYDGSGKWVKFYTLGLVIDKSRPDPIVWLSLEGGKYRQFLVDHRYHPQKDTRRQIPAPR